MALDFSHLEASPAHTGQLDFSSLGAIPAVGGQEEESTSTLGAAGRGAVGMLPLGNQAYAGIESVVDNAPYLAKRQELEADIEADKANHPGARLAGQVAGVAAPALLTGGASLPGGALAEGALYGAGFGAGNAIDTLAEGGSGTKAAGDVALGAITGGAGGAAGKALGNVITKVSKPFVNSQKEYYSEAVNKLLGGTARQVRALPGNDFVDTLYDMGQQMHRFRVDNEPLINITDQMSTRLKKFLALQEQSGKTIGDTIRTAGVKPMSITPIQEEMNAALKFATPDDQAQMNAVLEQVKRYANPDGTISFERVQQLKREIGNRAFEGEGNPALKSAYHTVSDIQDRELERVASTINKPEFDSAKEAYKLTSRAIPMLEMAVSKELAGKTGVLIPAAALLAGHPVVAAGALMKNRLAQMGSGAVFKGIQAIPENAGATLGNIPGKVGGQVAGAAVQQNMGETHPVPGKGAAPSPSKKVPNVLNIDHPALAQWKGVFQRNAANAKNPGEVEKSHAVTDFILSQRDPAYAAAKQKMADEPMPEAPAAPAPLHMAEGGVVEDPNKAFAAHRGSIEPGVMGETEPTEMKALKALNDIGMGYGLGQLGASVTQAAPKILKSEAGAIFPKAIGQNAPKIPYAGEMKLPEGMRISASPERPPTNLWQEDPGAMVGEPVLTMKDGKAAILLNEDKLGNQFYTIHRSGGEQIGGNFAEPNEAAAYAESAFSTPVKKIVPRSAPKMEGAAENGIEVYVKGIQKGPKGDAKIWGVKGPPELLKAQFGDAAPGSVPEHILREKGFLPETKDLSRMNAPNNFAKGGLFNAGLSDRLKAMMREKKDAKHR